MREYGKVYSAFWQDEDVRAMSEDGRVMLLYLMTCPHGNMLGCFRLPDGYAAEDLMWSSERVSKGYAELFQGGFVYRCEQSSYLFIRQFLKWNPFENPNVGKAARKLFDSMRTDGVIKSLLVNALREFGVNFPASVLEEYERVSEPFENPFELSSKTRTRARALTKPEPKPKPEPKNKDTAPPGGDAEFFPDVDPQLVSDFKKIRKAKNAPITKTAMDKIAAEAEKAGLSLEGAIRICVVRNWQGFMAKWMENDGERRSVPRTGQQDLQAANQAAVQEMLRREHENEN